jgi:hypothetical protein
LRRFKAFDGTLELRDALPKSRDAVQLYLKFLSRHQIKTLERVTEHRSHVALEVRGGPRTKQCGESSLKVIQDALPSRH